ncbi:MAG: OmpA family protein [Desulfovibrio sp.]|jgi:chemotaxis protein MotB|nr:OmpA family protein [Desulfovibrio sp.]
MARRKKNDGGGGDPAWLITFSDLMTLLLTFFVLLLSMSVIDERSKLVVLGSVTKHFGIADRVFNPKSAESRKSIREPGAMALPQDDLAPLRDMLFEDVSKDLNFMENKYVQILSINEQVLFVPGSTQLSPRGIVLLDRIVPYLQRIAYPLLVAGHTAARRDEEASYSVPKQADVPDSTWQLSFRRAFSVYRHMKERGIETGKLSLEAFGQFHPRYTNNLPEERRKNRRVDLVLDKRNLEWIRKIEALHESDEIKTEHYYKGFKFTLTMPGEGAPKGRQ